MYLNTAEGGCQDVVFPQNTTDIIHRTCVQRGSPTMDWNDNKWVMEDLSLTGRIPGKRAIGGQRRHLTTILIRLPDTSGIQQETDKSGAN